MNTYKTTAICPVCEHILYTSDIENNYSFVCKHCDQNFYTMEIKHWADNNRKEIIIPTNAEIVERHELLLRSIADKYRCHMIYNGITEEITAEWETNFPDCANLLSFVQQMESALNI